VLLFKLHFKVTACKERSPVVNIFKKRHKTTAVTTEWEQGANVIDCPKILYMLFFQLSAQAKKVRLSITKRKANGAL